MRSLVPRHRVAACLPLYFVYRNQILRRFPSYLHVQHDLQHARSFCHALSRCHSSGYALWSLPLWELQWPGTFLVAIATCIRLNNLREPLLEHSFQDYQPCWSCHQDDPLPWSWFRCSFPWYVHSIFKHTLYWLVVLFFFTRCCLAIVSIIGRHIWSGTSAHHVFFLLV